MRRSDAQERAALVVRLADEPEVAHPQVPEPAVDELGRAAGRGRAEVAALDERDVEAGVGRLCRDRGADDAAADHEQVEGPLLQPLP